MVKIVSGWSNPGGSTTAFVNLTNLFNQNNIECIFYGPHQWHLDKCNAKKLNELSLDASDILIVHFMKNIEFIPIKQMIFSCHEQEIFPLKNIKTNIYDTIVFVSDHQKQYHNLNHPNQIVIPNVVEDLQYYDKGYVCGEKIGAVIGSIDRNKQTHVAIKEALSDGCEIVFLFGLVTDKSYYENCVLPLINEYTQVEYPTYMEDKQKMYDKITDVYHYAKNESWGYVKAECEKTGTYFHSNGCVGKDVEVWSNDKIIETWKGILK